MPIYRHGVLMVWGLYTTYAVVEQYRRSDIFDLFHAETIVERTIRVLLKLESIADDSQQPYRPLCAVLFPRLGQRYLLLATTLFHGIAKGPNGDHSQLGARDVLELAALHDLPTEDVQRSSLGEARYLRPGRASTVRLRNVGLKPPALFTVCLAVIDICISSLKNSRSMYITPNVREQVRHNRC